MFAFLFVSAQPHEVPSKNCVFIWARLELQGFGVLMEFTLIFFLQDLLARPFCIYFTNCFLGRVVNGRH